MADTPRQDSIPAGDPADEGAGWLDATWVVLPAGALPGLPGRARRGERRFVLLHPARGIAILDTWSAWSATRASSNEEMAASLDAELTLVGFLRRFDPRLPVRRIHMAQAELPHLAGVLSRSYAGTPPLELPESWMDAVQSTLAVPQPPHDRAWRATRLHRIAGRSRLAAGIAALAAAGAVRLLTADGYDVGQRRQTAPIAAETGAPQVAASRTTLAIAAPEPAPLLAAQSRTASAEPAAEPAAITPPPGAGRTVGQTDLLPGTPPGGAESTPAALPDPARILTAAAVERAADRPAAVAPKRFGRSRRFDRPTVPSRFTQGWMPNSSGSFIWWQSQQYATGNGG